MSPNDIREAMHRSPFLPFSLRLADGRELHVPHPDFLAVANRRIVFIHPDDEALTILEPLLIVWLEIWGASVPPSANNGGTA